MRRYVLPASAAVLLLMIGCESGGEPTYLALSWEEFDQSRSSGWRPLAEVEDYAGAAKMIETYLAHRKDLVPAQRGYSVFHAGQLWALEGDTEHALELLDRATVDEMPPEFPRSFNPLVRGTRAFLRGDMATVRQSEREVASLGDRSLRDEEFLRALGLLARSEGLTYREVYGRARKEG